MTYKSRVDRHITDSELTRLMKGRITGLVSPPSDFRRSKRVRLITQRKINDNRPKTIEPTPLESSEIKNPLEDLERFLMFIHNHTGFKLTDIYKGLNLSGRKGGALKNKEMENGLITEEVLHTSGKGRPSKVLKLTEDGLGYIHAK